MKMKLIMQTSENECGLCAISMLASYYGFEKPIGYYRERFNVGRDGMSLKNLSHILSQLSLEPIIEKVARLERGTFKKRKAYIICVQNHYVVLEKIRKDICYIYDSAKGKRRISLDELNEDFAGYIVSVEKTERFEPTREKLNDFRYIFKIIKKLKRYLFSAILLSFACNVVTILIPRFLQDFIDSLIYDMKGIDLKYLNIKMLGLVIIYYLITRLRNNKLVELQGQIIENLSLKTISHLFKIPYSFFDNRTSGDIIFRLGLLKDIEKTLTDSFITIIISITTVIIILIYMGLYNIKVLLILLIIGLEIFLYMYIKTRVLTAKTRRQLSLDRSLGSLQSEIVVGMFQIKCMDLIQEFAKIYEDRFKLFKKEYVHNQKSMSNYVLNINIIELFIPILMVLIIGLDRDGSFMTVGQIFTIYVLTGYYVKYIASFSTACTKTYLIKESLFYVNDILDERTLEHRGGITVDNFKSLETKNIFFKYNDRQADVLKNINLKINKGDKIGIIGASGEGKTTLVKLIGRLYELEQGEILFNKIDISQIDVSSYNSLISIVPQRPIVFNKSIYENIVLNNEKIKYEDVVESLKIVNLWDEICAMPMKLNTTISGEGGNLSGGQVQRLTLARALAKKPKLLILDEATSSIDPDNEAIIHENLINIGISLIVISHRLSTLIGSNRIYELKEGELTMIGSYEDLRENFLATESS